MTSDKFDFNFDLDTMQGDLARVGTTNSAKQSSVRTSDKYVILPVNEGSVTMRILPAVKPNREGNRLPYASTRLHYLQLDPKNPKSTRAVHCLCELENSKWINYGQCPACNYYSFLFEEAKKAKSEDVAEMLKARGRKFKPIGRYYYNVIVRKEVNPETGEIRYNVGPKIHAAGQSQHEKILRAFCGNKKLDVPPIGNVAHPYTGRDWKLVKEIKRSDGQNFPEYGASVFDKDESVLGDDTQIEQWLANLWDLEAERTDNLKTAEEIQHMIDIICGNAVDDSKGFDSSKFNLPVDMQGLAGVERSSKPIPVERSHSSAPVARSSTNHTPVSSTNGASFTVDEDKSLVEDDWANDLQSILNEDN